MKGYLKGYYGYKNFGDELLLLGLIPYLFENYELKSLYIEAEDPKRLESWLERHQNHLPSLNHLQVVSKHKAHSLKRDHLFLGGGEVLTDGRSIPYNGRNYLFGFFRTIKSHCYTLLGGIGTPKKVGSNWLWKYLLKNATEVVVREKKSFGIVNNLLPSIHPKLYRDFAYDILEAFPKTTPNKKQQHILLNTNPYIWSSDTKKRLRDFAALYPKLTPIYFPAEIGVDDRYFEELQNEIPKLENFDRTKCTLEEVLKKVATCRTGMAARLHILLLLHRCDIPFEPLVYQEKISTFLETCSGEL